MAFGIYRIAEKNIAITTIYEDTHTHCEEYRTDDSAAVDFAVETTEADIDFEREKSKAEDEFENLPHREFSDGYLETLAVYRKISAELLRYGTFLFHGSAIAVDGETYLFTAKSGTGKSTHTRFWRQKFGERAVMVNDDKPLIRVGEDNTVTIFGTPWDGKHRLSTNVGLPLKAICILTRDSYNHIEKITASEAFPMLLQQSNRPAEPKLLMRTLELLDGLAANVGLYRLGCLPNAEAADVAYAGMQDAAK